MYHLQTCGELYQRFSSQYMTVYLKCDDRSCCSEPKTKVELFFPNRRIPALIPVRPSCAGPVAMVLEKDIAFPDIFARIIVEKLIMPEDLLKKYAANVPYDAYFPTQQAVVIRRVCKICSKYQRKFWALKGL